MRLNFTKLILTMFGSYRKLELPIEPGRHLVVGPNGSGKSTPFEALTCCFFPESTRDKDPSFQGEGGAAVTVELELGQDKYEVTRLWKAKDDAKSIQIKRNHEPVELRLMSELKAELERVVPITHDLFVSTIVVAQSLPINFMGLGKTARKVIVEEMVGSAVWGAIKTMFEKVRKAKETEHGRVRASYDDRRGKQISLESKIDTAQKMREESDTERDQRVVEVKGKIESLGQSVAELAQKFQTVTEKYGSSDQIEREAETLRSAATLFRQREKSLKTIIVDRVCPECERPWPESQLKAAEEELPFVREKLERSQSSLEVLSSQRDCVISLKNELNMLRAQEQTLKNQLLSMAQVNTGVPKIDIELLTKELAVISAEVSSVVETMNLLDSALKAYKYIEGLLVPSSKFRTDVLRRYIDFVNQSVRDVTPLIFPGVEMSLVLRDGGIDAEIKRAGAPIEYKRFSGGEKRRIDIALILSFQKFLQEASGVSSNLLVFDEIFEGLDQDGVDVVLSALESLFPEANSIYVITHRENVKSAFDSVLKVTKEGGESTVTE